MNERGEEEDRRELACVAPSRRARARLGAVIRSSRSTVSTAQLRVLRPFHLPPIKQVLYLRSYLVDPEGELISRSASHLDAFSGYPERT